MATRKYKYAFIVNNNETITIRRVIDGSRTKQKKAATQFHDVVVRYFDENEFQGLKRLEDGVRQSLLQEQNHNRRGFVMFNRTLLGKSLGEHRKKESK